MEQSVIASALSFEMRPSCNQGRSREIVILRDATLLQSRAIKGNQGQSSSIKGNQGRSHLLRGEELKVIEQSAKPLAAALGSGAGSVR